MVDAIFISAMPHEGVNWRPLIELLFVAFFLLLIESSPESVFNMLVWVGFCAMALAFMGRVAELFELQRREVSALMGELPKASLPFELTLDALTGVLVDHKKEIFDY